jgi:hypothetical protein
MRSVMVKHVELRGIEEYAALPFAHEAVVRRAIPQPGDRVAIFVGACVTVAVLHTLVSTKVEQRLRIAGRDDVPTCAAAADVVEAGETPHDVEWLLVGGRCGRDQADPLGHHGECGQKRERLERGNRVAPPQRLLRHVEDGQMVRHKEGVELRSLKHGDQPADAGEIKLASGHALG